MAEAFTVTSHVARFSPAFAVMTAAPSLTAVTLPSLSTVATVSSELLQVTVLSVASSGLTVATSVSLSPSESINSFLFSEIEVTAIGSEGSTGSAGLAACSTVNVFVVLPHLMVTVALRALSVSFGSALTVILTVPAPPELGSTVSQLEALVSVTVALQDSVAVKVKVWVWGCGWLPCCEGGVENEMPLLKTAWLCVGIVMAGLFSGCGWGWFGFSQE